MLQTKCILASPPPVGMKIMLIIATISYIFDGSFLWEVLCMQRLLTLFIPDIYCGDVEVEESKGNLKGREGFSYLLVMLLKLVSG